jgi:formate--tetrahydrofolate ligase
MVAFERCNALRLLHPTLLPVESVRIAAGAGYLLVLTGDIVTMPGLPREPAACRIDLTDDGEITGI